MGKWITRAFAALARWLCACGSLLGRYSCLDTLRQRYARGEIGRAEYEQLKRDLAD